MDHSRIAELLHPFLAACSSACHPEERSDEVSAVELSPVQLQSISTYINLLLRWNAGINLTAVRDPENIVTRHFGESLFAARHLSPFPGDDLIDIGSGAGFPGLPIKILFPHLHLTLIESNHKKVAFLREVSRIITLTDINVISGRAESLPAASAHTVTLRAVERFDSALLVAARIVAASGRLALLISRAQVPRTHLLAPDFNWRAPIPTPLSSARLLLIGTRA
jgi:16S rRNA (guanine527-N7)-methyltransferase